MKILRTVIYWLFVSIASPVFAQNGKLNSIHSQLLGYWKMTSNGSAMWPLGKDTVINYFRNDSDYEYSSNESEPSLSLSYTLLDSNLGTSTSPYILHCLILKDKDGTIYIYTIDKPPGKHLSLVSLTEGYTVEYKRANKPSWITSK